MFNVNGSKTTVQWSNFASKPVNVSPVRLKQDISKVPWLRHRESQGQTHWHVFRKPLTSSEIFSKRCRCS